MRNTAGASSTPNTPIEIQIDGPATARTASSSTMPGSAMLRLFTQLAIASNGPP